MALEDFWINVKSAARRYSMRHVVDQPRLDAEGIDEILADPSTWLTPEAVEGYDPSDFETLANPDKDQLDGAVRRLLEVARQVPPGTPPTPEQVERAQPEFRLILEILHPDRYDDPEAFLIGEKIEALVQPHLPGWVHELVFGIYIDASGSPAIRIYAEVEDEVADEECFYSKFALVRKMLEKATTRVSPERWPYIHLRSVTEQRPKVRTARR